MSWLSDLLQEYPALSVAKQRLQLAADRLEDAERTVLELKTEIESINNRNKELEEELANLRPGSTLDGPPELERLLVHLFTNPDDNYRHVDAIAQALGVQTEMAKYYLDELDKRGLATLSHGNYVTGHSYFALTDKGRAFVAENGLV